MPSATWNDIVDRAIWEVLEAGLGAPQITRRLSALLGDLLADLPAERHPTLLRYANDCAQRSQNQSTLATPGVG